MVSSGHHLAYPGMVAPPQDGPGRASPEHHCGRSGQGVQSICEWRHRGASQPTRLCARRCHLATKGVFSALRLWFVKPNPIVIYDQQSQVVREPPRLGFIPLTRWLWKLSLIVRVPAKTAEWVSFVTPKQLAP